MSVLPGGTPLVVQSGSTSSTAAANHTSSVHLPNSSTTVAQQQQSSSAAAAAVQPTNAMPPGAASGASVADQFSVKVRQEVYVMQRISELQRDGMWTDRRLPKCQEPQRPKAHWDYLLEEMVWLASDFAQERKWKKAAAKKCSRMVQKYFADKALAAQRAEKAHELQLRRIAAAQAKEIKLFWSNVEKLVEYKQHTHITEKRKQAMDQHLSFIVDQTERFSKQLTVGMNKGTAVASTSTSASGSRVPSLVGGTGGGCSDDEFSPGNASSEDDEETIAMAERDAHDVSDEIAALQKESEMDMDEFLNELPANYLKDREGLILGESKQTSLDGSDDDDDAEDDDDEEEEDEEAGEDSSNEDGAIKKGTTSKEIKDESAAEKSETVETAKRKMRPTTRNQGSAATVAAAAVDEPMDDNDDEYCVKEQSDDDEDTIQEQEANEKVDHQKEIDELNVSRHTSQLCRIA